MISVRSWIVVDKRFVPIEEFGGPIKDEEYIDGAIELVVDGVAVLTRDHWDLVDQLWDYLVRGLQEVCAGRTFVTYFPDMPVQVTLTPAADRVTIRVGEVEATADRGALVSAMASAAISFFERIAPFVSRHRQGNAAVIEAARRLLAANAANPS